MTGVQTLQLNFFGFSANATGDLAIAALVVVALAVILPRMLR